MYRYYTHGVCSKSILLDIEDNKLIDVVFEGGCDGCQIAIRNLIKGQDIDFIIEQLENIPCKSRETSCPDQLAKALKVYKEFVK